MRWVKSHLILQFIDMKSLFISIIVVLFFVDSFAQEAANNQAAKKEKNKYVIGFIPSSADNIFGIAIGLIG